MAPGSGHTGATAGAWRGRLTDPAAPTAVLVLAVLLAAFHSPTLTWAVTGGLAGFSLSGSV
ncbi:hypothetical protein E0L36_03860 [Streptomyces sp. AJS327]|uniref:hypothetical protein n=1 Tax=Streptomyces sp. AJS327 TaxID=2545265 RepID=UPI0015DEC7A1|nr:hypothetical protein [Streptomyces sp. AJS327]MBA0050065.1 hypothetical protein [Streptomyces sp. AJS327]